MVDLLKLRRLRLVENPSLATMYEEQDSGVEAHSP